MRRPAPQTRYASQFGHVLRILEIYHKVENVLSVYPHTLFTLSTGLRRPSLANKEGPARIIAIAPLRKQLEVGA